MQIVLRGVVWMLAAIAAVGACAQDAAKADDKPGTVTKAPFGKTADGQEVDVYTLTNAKGVKARIITYGAIVVSLEVPDKAGKMDDVVKMTIYVVNIRQNKEIWRARREFFGARLHGKLAPVAEQRFLEWFLLERMLRGLLHEKERNPLQ